MNLNGIILSADKYNRGGECGMPKPRKKQSRKNKSYVVVKEGTKTKRPSPPGIAEREESCDGKESSNRERVSDINEEEN